MSLVRTSLLAALITLPIPAFADDAPEPVIAEADADGAILAYPVNFFDEFAPVTALDIINRVPGFSLSNGNTQSRGLADAFGNLLIDGQRPSDKTVSLGTILSRIPAGQVERIELIREPLPEYEMRGFSQLANVILREGADTRQSIDFRLFRNNSQRLNGHLDVSRTIPVAGGEMTFSLHTRSWGPTLHRFNEYYDASDQLVGTEREDDQRRFRVLEPSIRFNGPIGDNTRLLLNVSGEFGAWRRTVNSQEFDDTGTLGAVSRLRNDDKWWEASLTTTLTHDFADQLSSETQFLLTREDSDNGPEVFTYTEFGAGTEQVNVIGQNASEETALRQTFNWTLTEAHSVELGGEIAFNANDVSLEIFEDVGAGLVEVDLPVANTRVEELRGELFGNYVWVINEAFSVEGGLRYEYSEITQSGDANQARTFNYWKPSMSGTWRPGDQRRFRVSLERNVDQLSFGSFASSVDLNDDQVSVGNPDYRPQSDWTLEGEFEQRFNEDASMTLTVGRVWVTDLDDFIAITTPGGDVYDAPGNIGDGTLNRVTLDWTSPLGWLGLRNATLDGFLEWFDSDVTDPVTGVERSWSHIAEWEARFDFRQTFPDLQMAWGWDYFYLSDSAIFRASRFDNLQHPAGDLDVYVETTRWFNLTTRLGADFLLDSSRVTNRTFYEGSRADGQVLVSQRRRQDEGPMFYLQVRGAF